MNAIGCTITGHEIKWMSLTATWLFLLVYHYCVMSHVDTNLWFIEIRGDVAWSHRPPAHVFPMFSMTVLWRNIGQIIFTGKIETTSDHTRQHNTTVSSRLCDKDRSCTSHTVPSCTVFILLYWKQSYFRTSLFKSHTHQNCTRLTVTKWNHHCINSNTVDLIRISAYSAQGCETLMGSKSVTLSQ